MTNDPVEEAIRLLQTRREEALAEVERIDNALTQLGRPTPRRATPSMMIPIDLERSGFTLPDRPSVRSMLVSLLTEGDGRDWNVAEVLAEYQKRGTPVHGKDPENALRAAVNEAYKAGQIIRTAHGRYRIAPPKTAEERLREAFPGADASG